MVSGRQCFQLGPIHASLRHVEFIFKMDNRSTLQVFVVIHCLIFDFDFAFTWLDVDYSTLWIFDWSTIFDWYTNNAMWLVASCYNYIILDSWMRTLLSSYTCSCHHVKPHRLFLLAFPGFSNCYSLWPSDTWALHGEAGLYLSRTERDPTHFQSFNYHHQLASGKSSLVSMCIKSKNKKMY